jgi:hypothetical protein
MESMAEITVTVTNLTNNQPLSPPAVILHEGTYSLWQSGSAASDELELLAESGNPADVITAAQAHSGVATSMAGTAVIMPGTSSTIVLELKTSELNQLSLATMLVNTNDAITGALAVDVSELALNDTLSLHSLVYDAGTEANTETLESVPGPAAGGEGYNASREGDSNKVSIHPGVITASDGLSTSALNFSHAFDNPAALITISRSQ